ncbi:Lar family restriction alleviation protein [Comamonas aquatica]|uniref:Lar family restriction alleviation protein n=1 Tax=Comamonas aquatica TaxID=225991 RepID=UPI00244795AA|nr:Lar family restriction alleviation protein [Comamonas aquatica]MDH1766551.1 Lar family restriction alleviation protein [Comamonas aquatica]
MNNAINLLPCPMCGCNSITIKNEQPTDNSGGYFIECPDCGTSTSLRYACGDDPMPLLAEQWNRRTSTQHLRQIAEPAQAGEPVVSMLTFVNGEPAKCGCRFSHSDGGGEYSNVGSVTLCAKHAGNRTERASPFMWAIQEPGGGAYMDEGCVSSVREDVQAEVDGLNSGLDADDDPYKVVPVYLAAAPQAVQPAVPTNELKAILADTDIGPAQTGFVSAAAYDRLQALCDSQAERILAAEDAEPVHWRAVLDPEQVPHQLKTSMHAVGFRDQQSAESWIAERLDFDGWRYTLQPLYAAPQAVQAAVPEAIEQMAVDRYKVVPSHESMFHRWAVVAGNGTQQLYIGREGECQNMARKFMGAFLDGAFVAMQNAAPAHPAEGVPAQCPNINEPRGCWRVACQLGGKCREPERSATQPAAQGMDALDAARYRWLRDTSVPPHNFYLSVPDEFKDERYTPREVDAAIDAALAAQAKQGG